MSRIARRAQSAAKKTVTGGGGTSRIISMGKASYSSTGTASYANSSNYDQYWDGDGAQSLAIDLSNVPSANRQAVMLTQFCETDDGFSAVGEYSGQCPAWSGRPYLSAYTIQVNSAAGGGAAPTTGWATVATVTGSAKLSQGHYVNFAGNNWIRLVTDASQDYFAIKIEVTDISSGMNDGWLFTGDSITNTYASHYAGGFDDQVYAASGRRVPHLNFAMSCTATYDALDWIDDLMDRWFGKYITLNYGGNDGYGGGGHPDQYYTNMLALVDMLLARGYTPVIPTVTWPNNGGAWESGIVALNDKIRELYVARPQVIPGPDLYALTYGHTDWYNGEGDVHPNETGATHICAAWVATAAAVYAG